MWLFKSAWAGEAKASIVTKIFSGFRGIPCWETRFSAWLVRVPKWGNHKFDDLECSVFWKFSSRHGLYWKLLLGFSPFLIYLECRWLPWGGSSEEGANWFRWVHLEKSKHTPFPVILIFQISIIQSMCLDTKWAEDGRYPSMPQNVSALSKYPLVASLKFLCK